MNALRLLCLLVTWLVSCEPLGPALGEDTASEGSDVLVVSPAELDFGSLSVLIDGQSTGTFSITNAGDSAITVHGHDEPVGDDVFAVDADAVFQLEGGESRDISVTFTPSSEGEFEALLRVNYGLEQLVLTGSATAPVLDVEIGDIEATAVGCEGLFSVVLFNLGSEQLTLSELSMDSEEFILVDEGFTEIPAQSSATLSGSFLPREGGTRTTSFTLNTNDPRFAGSGDSTWSLSGLGFEGSGVTETFSYAPGLEADLLVLLTDTPGLFTADPRLDAGASLIEEIVEFDHEMEGLAGGTGTVRG
ncbi:MAG: choice-of-anchor D domain-containing protein, partial [Myxococcota bacterium]|nr:choice-of-anchor D domain-containing protein [Myxococcota bacterium]